MVNPEKITNYRLTDSQLEEHILFWVCAAGKNGRTAAKSLNKLLKMVCGPLGGPMHGVFVASNLYDLPDLMRACGIGCFNNKARTFTELATEVLGGRLNLRTCSADDLEKIYGIGMKTSRCFIMHSRDNARCAGLDTHILKYLKAEGIENVPKSTPGSKKQYKRLEQEFLRLADEQGKQPATLDLEVWNKYSVKST
jgi:thermostable 8-oxoguanine DNA glycosylase